MAKIFIRLYHFFAKRQSLLYITFVSLFLLMGFFAWQVKFEEDISKILPKDKKIDKFNQVLNNAKFADKLVVTISAKDTTNNVDADSLVAYADELAAALQTHLSGYINSINSKIDDSLTNELFGTVVSHLPIYLNQKDYAQIDSLITPEKVKQTLAENLRTLTSPAGFALKNIITQDPVGITFLALKKLQQLQYDENFELYDNYVMTKDRKHLLIFVQPTFAPNNTGKNSLLLQGIDKIIDSLSTHSFTNVGAAYFGATAVSVGNALQLRSDALLTQGFTILFIIIFLGIYFRKKTAPFIILIPVVFGALFSVTAIYFLKGKISVIALGTGSVILGIAVNYSLHIFNHYRHTKSIEAVISDLAFPLTIGSFTTIGGFFCLEFVESEMLKDLGLFAAFSLMGASLASLVFLPHFIASSKQKSTQKASTISWIDKVAAYNPAHNKCIVGLILLLTLFFACHSGKVSFQSDLEAMNFMPAKLKNAEANLNRINEYALKSVYIIADGKNVNEALINSEKIAEKIEGLKNEGIVKKYSGVSALVVSDSVQQQRIARWKMYWTEEKKAKLLAELQKQGGLLGYKTTAFANFQFFLNKDFERIDDSTLATIRKTFLDDYITQTADNATVVTLVKVASTNKEKIYSTFENDSTATVVDKQYLTQKFVSIINADFTTIALMTSILVFIVLLITYGRIELTLVSFIPMFIAWVWILGIMGLFDIRFNIVNIIVSALIFGLGDDYSLFIMDGLLNEYKTGKKNLSSYKSSIFLSAITTVAGLGVLIFAKHPALRSIAAISIIGIVSVVLMSQVLIPFFFSLLIKNRTKRTFFPWTIVGLAKSIFAFLYFIFGAIILTGIGFILAKLNPFDKEKGKYLFHVILSKYCASLIYIMANVKKEIINLNKEDFAKPAIIICNHQSFLDILMTVMLHPKLILFTNNWVWNSPVFGAVVRLADYYPVEAGVENSLDKIANRIKNGYSVVIFPEGTRSPDDTIKRFHKGAFFLAEKLQVDILPIVIHGSGYTMSKGDFLLKDGKITLTILPRIRPVDLQYGQTYAERTKAIGQYFRAAFTGIKKQIEQPAYYKEKLIYNYLYKGPELEWYLRIKLLVEKNYHSFHELMPDKGKILDIGCGYGFLSYLLHFAAPQRAITGVDYDEQKIKTAAHCFSKTTALDFYFESILHFKMEAYDGIVICDVLHYLQPDEQQLLIEKCIQHLEPGGVIAIRDGNKDLKERHSITRFTEFFSTRFFSFNKVSGKGLSFLSGSLIKNIAATHQVSYQEIDQSKFTSNIIYLLKKNKEIDR